MGSEVAQLYTHQLTSSVTQPLKSLRRFERVTLRPDESKTIRFALPVEQLAFYDVKSKTFVVEPGTFHLMVGSSSEDIRLRAEFTVVARRP